MNRSPLQDLAVNRCIVIDKVVGLITWPAITSSSGQVGGIPRRRSETQRSFAQPRALAVPKVLLYLQCRTSTVGKWPHWAIVARQQLRLHAVLAVSAQIPPARSGPTDGEARGEGKILIQRAVPHPLRLSLRRTLPEDRRNERLSRRGGMTRMFE